MFFRNFALIALLVASPAFAEHRHAASTAAREAAAEDPDTDDTFYRYRLNSGLGVHVLEGSGLLVSGQFGYAMFGEHSFFIGPEMSFAFVGSGTLFGVWASGWYEHKFATNSRLSYVIGAVGGPSFTSHVDLLPTTSWSAFLDLGVMREIDDLASLRVQLRPGVDGGRFAFLAALIVSFHFL